MAGAKSLGQGQRERKASVAGVQGKRVVVGDEAEGGMIR